MSCELETLDQLLGGELSLAIIRQVYPDEKSFRRGVHGLLNAGDVQLLANDGSHVPAWRWQDIFLHGSVMQQLDGFKLAITEAGAKKIR